VIFAESGKLNTWGSTTELGQCYLISGKQQVSARLERFFTEWVVSFPLLLRDGVSRRVRGALPCRWSDSCRTGQKLEIFFQKMLHIISHVKNSMWHDRLCIRMRA
jgi:hypothetical protein